MSESIDPGMEVSAPPLPKQPVTPPPAETPPPEIAAVVATPEIEAAAGEPAIAAPVETPAAVVAQAAGDAARDPALAARTIAAATPVPPEPPLPPVPPLPSAPNDAVADARFKLQSFFKSRLFLTAALLFVLAEFFFSDGGHRDRAVDFLENDVKAPIAAVSPFKLLDVFADEASTCSGGFSSTCSFSLTKLPRAVFHTVKYIGSQGLAGLLILGLPALFIALGLLSEVNNSHERGNLLMAVHPGVWVAVLLGIGCLSWVLQFVALAMLFVVKQTILAFALIGVLLLAYDKFEMWNKIVEVGRSWSKPA